VRARVTAVTAVIALIVAASSVAAASTAASRTCLTEKQTHGLGLSAAGFHKENPSTFYRSPTAQQAYGVAYYWIKTKSKTGCVTAYLAYERLQRRPSDSALLRLFARTFLPADARQVARKLRCSAWESQTFFTHFGMAYAVAVVVANPNGGPFPATALMLLSRKQIC